METLTAKKERVREGRNKGSIQTKVYKSSGVLYAVFSPYMRQPRRNSKTIMINGYNWPVQWAPGVVPGNTKEENELLDSLKTLLSSYQADFQTITGSPLNNTEAVKKAKETIKKYSR